MEVKVLRSDETAFAEHKIEHTPARLGRPATTTCWLEIEQDKTFSISIKLHEAILDTYYNEHYRYATQIDGSYVNSHVDSSTDRANRGHRVNALTYTGVNGDMTGKMKFKELLTVEDLKSANRQIAKDEDSSITISIDAGYKGLVAATDALKPSYNKGSEGGIVQEKEAKRMYSAVCAVDAKPAIPRQNFNWHQLDDHTPYHRFVFKYRTRPILELLEIVKPVKPVESAKPVIPLLALGHTDQVKDEKPDVQYDAPMNDGDGAFRATHSTVLQMRREIDGFRRALREVRKEQSRARPEVVDLTGDDSD